MTGNIEGVCELTRWYVSTGHQGARRYVSDVVAGPAGLVVSWCDDFDAALRFDRRGDAVTAARAAAAEGQTVATIPLDPA